MHDFVTFSSRINFYYLPETQYLSCFHDFRNRFIPFYVVDYPDASFLGSYEWFKYLFDRELVSRSFDIFSFLLLFWGFSSEFCLHFHIALFSFRNPITNNIKKL